MRLASRLRTALLASAIMAALPVWAQAAAPTVKTNKGTVVGLSVGTVNEFLGVPYAAPPVGDLRFRAPVPHAPWTTPIQATQVAAVCPQIRPVATGSEDCLYLNVYAPVGAVAAGRPVMVYFPGGGFVQGSASSPYYNSQYIVQQSGVIVVTVTYRVGALGFLTTPALDAENPNKVSGNYGLLDQRQALRWVRENIAAFGGDPANVTLFGESAGADSIEYQLSAPATAGLYQHAIIESSVAGFLIPSLPIAVSEATGGATVVAAVGCAGAADVAACLRALPAYAFLAPVVANPGSTLPVVDGVVVPQAPLAAYRSGKFVHVPVIFGTNHDEGTAFVWPIEAAGGPLTAAGYSAQLQTLYGASALKVLGEYPLSAYPSPIQALAAVYTDGNVACPTSEKRAALSRAVPVYGYELNEVNPAQGSLLGPPEPGLSYGDYHTADLPYVFGVTAPAGVRLTNQKDINLSGYIINYWTNLATSGNPDSNLGQGPFWFNEGLMPSLLSFKDYIQQLPEAQFRIEHHCKFWAGLSQS